jgi:small conductance mechanosensitive channel
MKWRPIVHLTFIFFLAPNISILTPCHGEDQPDSYGGKISHEEIKRVIEILEDPEKRETFLYNLKAFLKAYEEMEIVKERKEIIRPIEKRPIFTQRWSSHLYRLAGNLIESALNTFLLLEKIPYATEKALEFLSEKENQLKIFILFLNLFGGLIAGLFTGLFSRRYLRKMKIDKTGLFFRIWMGFIDLWISMIPYGVLIAFMQIIFDLFPSFPIAHSIIMLFLLVIFFNRMAIAILRNLFSSREKRPAILEIREDKARFICKWASRFVNYLSFYFALTLILSHTGFPEKQLIFIKSILIVIFSFILSAFIIKSGNKIWKIPGKKGSIWRYSIIPAMLYLWAITIFFIFPYQKGFLYLFKASIWSVFILIIVLLALKSIDELLRIVTAWSERTQKRIPELKEKVDNYIKFLRMILRGILWAVGLGFILHTWGVPIGYIVSSKAGSMIISRGMAIGITVWVVLIIIEINRLAFHRLLQEREGREVTKKMKTLAPLLSNAIIISSIFIGGIIVLDRLGVNIKPILAGAGIAGLAVGFGAQSLVKDVINGLFILFEDSIRVGDVAILKDKGGVVEGITLRSIKLRDISGNVHWIPNSSIETVTNMTKGYSMYVFDVGVAYREDVDEVMTILREIGEEMLKDPEYGKDILEPLEVLGVDRFEDSAVIIKARIKTKPIRQWAVGREFNRRIKKVFDQRGIEIPFPHRTIYMGEPKGGKPSPLVVHLKEIKGGEK